jgi:hypothetical protein
MYWQALGVRVKMAMHIHKISRPGRWPIIKGLLGDIMNNYPRKKSSRTAHIHVHTAVQ